jgi:nucleotide-binding universal stress UspA family protein
LPCVGGTTYRTLDGTSREEKVVVRNGIIVGVDGSLGSQAALSWAADEARLRGHALLLLNAPAPADVALVRAAGEPVLRALDDAADRLLYDQAAAASAAQPGIAVSSLLSHSSAADALIDLSVGAVMIVVGSRGHGSLVAGVLGSVSTRVAAHAHCPVIVVPHQPALQQTNGSSPPIVVGMSDTVAGRAAMDFALDEASRRGADVLAVRAGSDVEAHAVKQVLDDYRNQYEDLTIVGKLVPSDPAEAMLSAAHCAQLVVIGCRHSDDRWSMRLGPIATTVLHNTPCPVAVIGAVHRRDQGNGASRRFVPGLREEFSRG